MPPGHGPRANEATDRRPLRPRAPRESAAGLRRRPRAIPNTAVLWRSPAPWPGGTASRTRPPPGSSARSRDRSRRLYPGDGARRDNRIDGRHAHHRGVANDVVHLVALEHCLHQRQRHTRLRHRSHPLERDRPAPDRVTPRQSSPGTRVHARRIPRSRSPAPSRSTRVRWSASSAGSVVVLASGRDRARKTAAASGQIIGHPRYTRVGFTRYQPASHLPRAVQRPDAR